ncbi:MAG: sialidase family protein [Candidatus Omnitrophica bacterium]|nr:sialidase family protein [Candidatus Omnitrophota bacterium]
MKNLKFKILLAVVSFSIYAGLSGICYAAALNYAPTVGTITPSNSSSIANTTVEFTTTYIDQNGYQDIQHALFFVNTTYTSNTNCFLAYYDQPTNKLYLRSDNGTAWTGGFAPGSNNIISNTQGSLNCLNTTISRSGATLTIKWNVTYKAAFLGQKNMYLFARDKQGAKSDYILKGTWNIMLNQPPTVGTITPSSGSSIAEQAVEFTATYSDQNGYQDIAHALFLVNTTATFPNGFAVYYNQPENKLYASDGVGWTGGYAPGSSNIIQMTRGKLDCSKTTVSRSGTTLTMKWNVAYKAAFLGQKNMYLFARDKQNAYSGYVLKGTWSIASSDVTPPTGSIKINNDAQYTNSVSVILNLAAQDNQGGSGLADMKFSNDGVNWSTSRPYSTAASWGLYTGDSQKTVFVKFSDRAGNWSQVFSDTIILDTTPPTVTVGNYSTSLDGQIIGGARELNAPITVTAPSLYVRPVSYPDTTTWSCYVGDFVEGENTITVETKDAAGNSGYASGRIYYQRLRPNIDISPNIQVTNDPAETMPDIAIFEGTVYAVWQNNRDGKIYFDKSNDGGITWNVLRKAIETGSFPKIRTDGSGNIYIVWRGSNAAYFIKSTDGGITFSDKIAALAYGTYPDLAVSESGNIVYVSASGDCARSIDGGLTFERPVSAVAVANIECSKDGRFVYGVDVLGPVPPEYVTDIRLVRSQDYGLNFETPKVVDTYYEYSGGYNYDPDIAIGANNEIYTIWSKKHFVESYEHWKWQTVCLAIGDDYGRIIDSLMNPFGYSDSRAYYRMSSLVAADSGNIYVTYVGDFFDPRWTYTINLLSTVMYFNFSEDGGLTFDSVPIPVYKYVNTGYTFGGSGVTSGPKIAINPQGNRICIIWSSLREDDFHHNTSDIHCVRIKVGQ